LGLDDHPEQSVFLGAIARLFVWSINYSWLAESKVNGTSLNSRRCRSGPADG
jgi:hypothetical protein